MKYLKLFENYNDKFIGYHVTRRKNLKSILKNGIEPRIPKDYGDTGDIKGVYLFKSLEDTETALYSWLGERIEDWEEENDKEYDEVVLAINIKDLDLFDSVEYEWICLEDIKPDRIIDILGPDLKSIK